MIVQGSVLELYHASYCAVDDVDLSFCKKRNDFGQGFYLTTSKTQAKRFIATAVKKAGSKALFGYINKYRFADFLQLSTHEFVATNTDWLYCVCAHRQPNASQDILKKWSEFDIIAGKIANDNTMTVINVYLSGGYGEYGSDEAITMAIKLLKPDRLENQLCLKSNAAINKLTFINAEKVKL